MAAADIRHKPIDRDGKRKSLPATGCFMPMAREELYEDQRRNSEQDRGPCQRAMKCAGRCLTCADGTGSWT